MTMYVKVVTKLVLGNFISIKLDYIKVSNTPYSTNSDCAFKTTFLLKTLDLRKYFYSNSLDTIQYC